MVAGDDIYGGTSRLLDQVLPGMGVEVANVEHTDLNVYKRAFIDGRTKLVILESPTNPRMRVRPSCPASLVKHPSHVAVLSPMFWVLGDVTH